MVPMRLPAQGQVGCLSLMVTSDPDKWLSKTEPGLWTTPFFIIVQGDLKGIGHEGVCGFVITRMGKQGIYTVDITQKLYIIGYGMQFRKEQKGLPLHIRAMLKKGQVL